MNRSRVATLLLDLPAFVESALIVLLVADLLGFVPWCFILLAVWLGSGPLVLIPAVEDWFMSGSASLRRADRAEVDRLRPRWEAVCRRAEVNGGRFRIWVEETELTNAFATAGHTIAVTRRAARSLPEDQLEAVLAHELGHHVGGHTWAGLLRRWYGTPARVVLGFAGYLSMAVVSAWTDGGLPVIIVVTALVAGVTIGALILVPVLGVVLLLAILLPFPERWLRRRREHEADLVALDLGYGEPLLAMLGEDRDPTGRGVPGWLRRAVATHPSNAERARFLDRATGATARPG